MAQRRIVAASDVGGHRELVTHGETGILFPSDNPAGCAAALADLLDRRATWTSIRDRAGDHVARYHDWSRNVGRYQDVYHLLLGPVSEKGIPAAA